MIQVKEIGHNCLKVDEEGKIINEYRVSNQVGILTVDNIQFEFSLIPNGKGLIGGYKGEKGFENNEFPRHYVDFPAFYLMRSPVSQDQWKAIADKSGKLFNYAWDDKYHPGKNYPANSISWDNAVIFAQVLSELSQEAIRLPKESEWEYAARAGSTTPFCYGLTLTDKIANFDSSIQYDQEEPNKNKKLKVCESNKFVPNEFGLYSVHGNCWELCADSWSDDYQNQSSNNHSDVESDSKFKVARGGSVNYHASACRSSSRLMIGSKKPYRGMGLRLLMEAAF